MIEIIDGTVGNGKTMLAATLIAARLARGCHVYTNIEILWEGMEKLVRTWHRRVPKRSQLHILEMGESCDFHKHVVGGATPFSASLAVLDEVHLWFNARDWQKTSRGLLDFLSQSRKVRLDVMFISQSKKNIDSQFLRQAAFGWECRNMSEVRIMGMPYPFKEILAIRFDLRERLVNARKRIPICPLVWNSYNTEAILSPLEISSKESHGLEQLDTVPPWHLSIDWSKIIRWGASGTTALASGAAIGRLLS